MEKQHKQKKKKTNVNVVAAAAKTMKSGLQQRGQSHGRSWRRSRSRCRSWQRIDRRQNI